MMRLIFTALLLPTIFLFSQDEFQPQGIYSPNFFAELLDVEIYSSDMAFIVGVGGFIFIDISDIGKPSFIGRYDPGSIYTRFYNGVAKGDLAIGAARLDGLYFLNIVNPSLPTLLKQYKKLNISYESVDFQSIYAYGAMHEAGLEIIDISDPGNPTNIKTISEVENAWDVLVDSTNLYVADGAGGLKIFSISNPIDPSLLTTMPTSGYAKEVIVEDNIAYVALGAAGIDIFDVSQPDQPKFLSNFRTQFGIVNHLAISNNHLFAATWELVMAINISNPDNPYLVATEDTPVRAMGIGVIDESILVSDWSRFRTYTFSPNEQADIHVKPSVFDFGFQGISLPLSKEFQIFNLGEVALNISTIDIEHPEFTIFPDNLNIPPGNQQTIDVTFTPSGSTFLFEDIKFTSNDPDESIKEIPIYAGQNRLAPGDPAPDFSLTDIDGIEHTLSHYQGKIVILAFFATW